jgi:hypothetical protein
VAHLLYRWRGQPLSVYVLNRRLEDAHGPDTHDSITKLGEHVIIWSDRGRTYAVVAQRSLPELEQIAGYVRRTVE